MNMGSGLSDSYGSSINSKQFSPNANNFSNFVGTRKIPFGSLAQHPPDSHVDKSISEDPKYQQYNQQKIPAERLPNEPEAIAEHNNTLASKFQEFKRLARPFFEPHLMDNVLSNLSLLAMSDNGWESLIDEIIEKLRNNTNILMEVFPQFEYSKGSNVRTRITKEVPLRNHHLERLPVPLSDAAIKKLAEIELILKPHYHPAPLWDIIEDFIRKFDVARDYSILDAAIINYRKQFQEYGMGRPY